MTVPGPGELLRIAVRGKVVYSRVDGPSREYLSKGTLVRSFRVGPHYLLFETLDGRYEGFCRLSDVGQLLERLSPLEQLALAEDN